ncbi:swim zinc finger domain protein [Xanthomonas fragariae]|uniref:Swim zinc finger domain protein n=4 Tax=Xanthomonas fragariae TaxID=48664 RepID=A0A1Y6H1X5_9XANT|nr:hypothetical protein [Xanthomonas fragariae]MEA5172475.1 hypothetical protein [Xanthomonas fragariae]MEA5197364.1 hypothetical protein [Xanthomonas fragariae]MEA5209722.1 hypothetical protein [Xanthomonas fragariae]SMQ97327.1 hypothetical protein PD885_00055 [Xanthomonas fragariae]SMR01380.1 swim zinc finger domain protein [Xanthomonas fragariae]
MHFTLDTMTPPSTSSIDSRLLQRLADSRSYARGLAYFEQGRAVLVQATEGRVAANVRGSENYRVTLEWDGTLLQGECDCPIGRGGDFCKHQVAVAFAWARGQAVAPENTSAGRKRSAGTQQPLTEVQEWLADMPAHAMRSLLLELAAADASIGKRLLAQAHMARSTPQEWRKAITTLLGRKRFMDYRASVAYARHIAPLPDLLDQALQRDPMAALDLHEYALRRLMTIYHECDDSSGHVGDALASLARSHVRFAAAAHPQNLPRRLLDLRLQDAWGLMPPLRDYCPPLDERDVAMLQHATLETLQQPLSAAQQLAAETLLEDAARNGGEVDAMLQWFAPRCSSGWDYFQMARRCREHRREREETSWLERGIRACPDDGRLKATLAAAYTRDGMTEEALQLRWEVFTQTPSEDAYLALRHATRAAHVPWESWRARALAAVAANRSLQRHAQDLQVRLFLAEGEHTAALQAGAAHQADIAMTTWERLLQVAESHDASFAVRIYKLLIENKAERTNQQGYSAALILLRSLRRLCEMHKAMSEFDDYLVQIRQHYRAKRTFIEMLSQAFGLGSGS